MKEKTLSEIAINLRRTLKLSKKTTQELINFSNRQFGTPEGYVWYRK